MREFENKSMNSGKDFWMTSRRKNQMKKRKVQEPKQDNVGYLHNSIGVKEEYY